MKIQKKQEIEFFGTKTGNANSIALGYATETKNFGEVAVGVMNKSTAAKDPNSSKGVCADPDATLFSVGCGGSGERKNALEVKGDGSVIIPGENGDINVADKIKQVLDTDASIELVKSTDSDLQYTLMVNNESRGSINIPKDQFLKNVTYDTEAKQLVFTFVTLDEEEHVERISINDLKDVYTAGNGINIDNNVISADFSSVEAAISDEKTQRETTDNEIKSTLDTKANKTDVNSRLDDLQNYCFKLGDSGEVAAPYNNPILESNFLQLNNNEEYVYADLSGGDLIVGETQYIYDKNLNKSIKIIELGEEIDLNTGGDFFKTTEPLDLTHTFYLDNEKTGVVENLTQLTIEESNFFVNLPYVEVDDNLEDDETPQYIYDATDNKWIEVVETRYINSYNGFNTEELLDLTHELYYSSYPNILGNWMLGGNYSTTIGYSSKAEGFASTAIGHETVASGGSSIAIGSGTKSYSLYSTSVGCDSSASGFDSIAIGHNTTTNNNNCIAIGSEVTANGNYSIGLGSKVTANGTYSTVLGYNVQSEGISPVCIGCNIKGLSNACISIGNNVSSKGTSSVAIGDFTNVSSVGSVGIGESSNVDGGSNSIGIGRKVVAQSHNVIAIGFSSNARFLNSLALGAYSITGGNYAIALGKNVSNTKSIFGVGFNGVNGIDMDRDNYGLYLKGFGGYDGTNLVVKSGDTETLNPDIKSVQQIINEKADSSAIPTKVSQLTNDANFITSYTETDPVWTREKTKYYTKTEIDGKGYLTAHQSLDGYAKKTEIPNVSTKADLVDGKLKAEQLPKLNNITAATTTEDMITKFNDLLADLKAKGYMTADITA